MRTVTKTYQVYSFDELNEEAKQKATSDEIQFWIETSTENNFLPDDIIKAFQKADAMQTPWFAASYIWEYAKDIILDGCKQYDYLADGEIFIEDNRGYN